MDIKLLDAIKGIVKSAVDEDLGSGDVTTDAIFGSHIVGSTGRMVAKEDMVICGQEVVAEVFKSFSGLSPYKPLFQDGERVKKGCILGEVEGSVTALLIAERTALNFFQRLSGIATKSNELSLIASKYNVKIKDTRKTTPGFRLLEKYAVKVGGGSNHRIGLFDAFMLKNNHIDACGGDIREAAKRCREYEKVHGKRDFLEIEVRDFKELDQALMTDAEMIMLDNFSTNQIIDAVEIIRKARPEVEVEASGDISKDNFEEYCKTGVDSISMGALTHSVRSVDISFRIQKNS